MNAKKLVENITYMVKNGDYIMGHSIIPRDNDYHIVLDKILQDGLLIQDSSKGVSFTARRFESEYNEALNNLLDLANNSIGIIVIIAIPGELLSNYDENNFESYDKTSILLYNTNQFSKDYTDVYGNPTSISLLPSSFILGYLDIRKDIFIENPNFKFRYDSRDKNVFELKPLLDEKYKKMTKKIILGKNI